MHRCLVIEPERPGVSLATLFGGLIVGLLVLVVGLILSGCYGRIEQEGCPQVSGSSQIDTTTLSVSCHPGESADVSQTSVLSPPDWSACTQQACSLTCYGGNAPGTWAITAEYADDRWVSTWQTADGCTVRTALVFR